MRLYNYTYNKNNKEQEIVLLLIKNLINPLTEVETIYGFVDILTDMEIIEVKIANKWKHAIGQILVYSKAYPEHTKRIHLFNVDDSINIQSIQDVCTSLNIHLTYEHMSST